VAYDSNAIATRYMRLDMMGRAGDI
jgi:hypothetical protein